MAEKLGVADCIANCIWFGIPRATKKEPLHCENISPRRCQRGHQHRERPRPAAFVERRPPAEQAISTVGCSQLELAVSIMPIGDMILFFVTEMVIESKTDSYIITVCLG